MSSPRRGDFYTTFPASSISLPGETVQDASFREAFTVTVAKMSQQSVEGTQLKAKKAAG
ncbi:hypothetical protein TGAMA5MH_10916 [Trichoderma gamsii]|uniref:DUF6606 domain-containing protein n=1 Tax=Trichoderma gamsii TaxID=398673 RepID=A0A2K0SV85_9HYPO|nr:hypothetical protein TGAMA5MH_10916 [Trichoderma gamsii]